MREDTFQHQRTCGCDNCNQHTVHITDKYISVCFLVMSKKIGLCIQQSWFVCPRYLVKRRCLQCFSYLIVEYKTCLNRCEFLHGGETARAVPLYAYEQWAYSSTRALLEQLSSAPGRLTLRQRCVFYTEGILCASSSPEKPSSTTKTPASASKISSSHRPFLDNAMSRQQFRLCSSFCSKTLWSRT